MGHGELHLWLRSASCGACLPRREESRIGCPLRAWVVTDGIFYLGDGLSSFNRKSAIFMLRHLNFECVICRESCHTRSCQKYFYPSVYFVVFMLLQRLLRSLVSNRLVLSQYLSHSQYFH